MYQFSECSFIFVVYSAFIGLSIQPALFLELVGNGWIFFFFSYQASAHWAGLCRQRWTFTYGLDLPAMPAASWRICL